MQRGIKWVGIDAHKDTLWVAVMEPYGQKAEELRIEHTEAAVKRLAKRLVGDGSTEVRACYEAGPTGYDLQRIFAREGIVCEVVAPALIPIKAGDRIKTDRRDAKKLAELLRAGMLTEVRAPTPTEEAVRGLCRARHSTKEDLTRCRNRLKKFLLQRSIRCPGPSHWTRGHHEWLRTLSFQEVADNYTFQSLYRVVSQLEDRVKELDERVAEFTEQPAYREPVAHLRCLRGVDTLTAMTIVTELHGFGRFLSPRALMAYLGLVPREFSSGNKQRRGGITKTGNTYVRRVLVEAGHHCSKSPQVGMLVKKRRREQPPEVVAIAERAQHRLHRRYWRLISAGKHRNMAVVAVAREMVGFIWAILHRAIGNRCMSSFVALREGSFRDMSRRLPSLGESSAVLDRFKAPRKLGPAPRASALSRSARGANGRCGDGGRGALRGGSGPGGDSERRIEQPVESQGGWTSGQSLRWIRDFPMRQARQGAGSV